MQALFEIDVSDGGKSVTPKMVINKNLTFPEAPGLSVMSFTTAMHGDTVQAYISLRVEKSDDATVRSRAALCIRSSVFWFVQGCVCRGSNITAKANHQKNGVAHGTSMKGVSQGECHGGTRHCTELWFYNGTSNSSSNRVQTLNYFGGFDAEEAGCQPPPFVVLPQWRMVPGAATGGKFAYLGKPGFCNEACMKLRTHATKGCGKYGPFGTPCRTDAKNRISCDKEIHGPEGQDMHKEQTTAIQPTGDRQFPPDVKLTFACM